MGTIKLQQNVLNGAGAKVSPIVSNNESARQKAKNVSSAMYDMSFSSRDALIGELRSIEQRLGRQTERMQQYGKMIHTICDELSAADRASATDAKNLNTRVSAISGAGETGLSLSTAVSLERIQQIAGSLLLPGYAIGCGIGRRLRNWIERIFPGRSSGSGHSGGGGRHDSDKPGKDEEIVVVPEDEVFLEDPSEIPGTPEYNSIHYDYNGQSFITVSDFSQKILDQCAYDGPKFRYGLENWGCTATASAMGMSMITGKDYNPTDDYFWTTCATWNGMQERATQDLQGMLAEAYVQLTDKQRPSVFYANRPNGAPHAVTIVGLRDGASPDNLTMGDFLVADPDHGRIRNLSELEYTSFNKLLIYDDILP